MGSLGRILSNIQQLFTKLAVFSMAWYQYQIMYIITSIEYKLFRAENNIWSSDIGRSKFAHVRQNPKSGRT